MFKPYSAGFYSAKEIIPCKYMSFYKGEYKVYKGEYILHTKVIIIMFCYTVQRVSDNVELLFISDISQLNVKKVTMIASLAWPSDKR